MVLNFNYINCEYFFCNAYTFDCIEFFIQNFSNNKWISSDTLLIHEYYFFDIDCFRIIDYKPHDYIIILFSGVNIGAAREYRKNYLIKLDINNDKFLRYEIF